MCPNPFYGGLSSPSFVDYNTLLHKRILESNPANSSANVSNNILFSAQVRYPGLTDREDYFCRALNTTKQRKILKAYLFLTV